jgi:chromosome segregation ATPase
MHVEESSAGMAREMEEIKVEKETLSHELRCARAEIEGCQGELRSAAGERKRILAEFEVEREKCREREEELIMTNQALDEELKETLVKVEEMKKQVSILVCKLTID